MNQPQFANQPCPKCSTQVMVAIAAGMGVCTTCQTQVKYDATKASAPTSDPASLMPTHQDVPKAPEFSAKDAMKNPSGAAMAFFQKFGKFGAIAGVVVVLAGTMGYQYLKKHYFGTGAASAGYGMLGIEKDKADPDKMISSVKGIAERWSDDAVFWGANFHGLRGDGTIDLSSGTSVGTVTYISLSGVQEATESGRENSIKKFSFNSTAVDYSKLWNATNRWEGVKAPPLPKCTAKALAKALSEKGLGADQTVSAQLDTQWGYNWKVTSEDKPDLNGDYSSHDCAKVK